MLQTSFKPTAAYSTSGHLAASHYSFSHRSGVDTIPCAQATLTVCDCMKYLVFPRFVQPGQNKVQIHQSFHKLIQFVEDLEIFDHAKLLTNGTLTILQKSSQTWILPKTNEPIRTSQQLPSRKFAAHSLHSILFSTIWINWMPAAAIQKANAETNSDHHHAP